MNCASARCSRAAGPRRKREARARQLGAGLEVQAQRRAQVDMVLRREVEGARRAPAPHLDVAGLVGAHGHAGVRQVGQATSAGCSSACRASSRSAPAFSSSAMPFTSAISAGRVLALALGMPICLLSALRCACSSSVRGLERLRSASSALKRATSRKGCGFLRASSGRPRRQVAAQQVDVEHGGLLRFGKLWARRERHGVAPGSGAGRRAAPRPAQDRDAAAEPRHAAVAQAARQREVHVSCTPSMLADGDTAPSSRSRAMTCCTRMSGADAPAVRPTRGRPSNQAGCRSSAPSTM
jgi:hypothetical protein